ncbi:MAG: hypothetical protein NVSMB21_24450 [Vulcanimicrobiaceae bacterium]
MRFMPLEGAAARVRLRLWASRGSSGIDAPPTHRPPPQRFAALAARFAPAGDRYPYGHDRHAAPLEGDLSSGVATGVDLHSSREPIGVVASITLFNFPEMVALSGIRARSEFVHADASLEYDESETEALRDRVGPA